MSKIQHSTTIYTMFLQSKSLQSICPQKMYPTSNINNTYKHYMYKLVEVSDVDATYFKLDVLLVQKLNN